MPSAPGYTDWDKSYGWGYMNVDHMYFHRTDHHSYSLVPRNDNAQDAGCQAYINQLEAQSGNHVDADDAEVLIYWAEQLQLQ